MLARQFLRRFSSNPMEVEVKIRLPSQRDYETLLAVLGKPASCDLQQNYYLDGTHGELGAKRVVFRLRRALDPESSAVKECTCTVKGNAVLANGISRVAEDEEAIAASDLAGILDNPDTLKDKAPAYPVIARFVQAHPCPDGYKVVGSFTNLRSKYPWDAGLVMEVDRTEFPFGVAWEIEIESTRPEEAKAKLEALLKTHDIAHADSQRNKFVNMLRGSIA